MKKLLDRIVVGAAIGILTGYLVTIIVNCGIGDGAYMPVTPVLEERCKTLMAAVLIQTLLTALIGVVFAVAGMIFEIESWSYLKQCVLHFFATVVFYLPFSFICWFPLKWSGFLGITGSVLLTYSLTFLINYLVNRHMVRQINEYMKSRRGENDDER